MEDVTQHDVTQQDAAQTLASRTTQTQQTGVTAAAVPVQQRPAAGPGGHVLVPEHTLNPSAQRFYYFLGQRALDAHCQVPNAAADVLAAGVLDPIASDLLPQTVREALDTVAILFPISVRVVLCWACFAGLSSLLQQVATAVACIRGGAAAFAIAAMVLPWHTHTLAVLHAQRPAPADAAAKKLGDVLDVKPEQQQQQQQQEQQEQQQQEQQLLDPVVRELMMDDAVP
jgi:hypothetical protein